MDGKTSVLNHHLDVVGIGNAIVDVLVQATDTFLQDHGLEKGSMTLLNEQQAEDLYSTSGPGLETSGGSAANQLQNMGIVCKRWALERTGVIILERGKDDDATTGLKETQRLQSIREYQRDQH